MKVAVIPARAGSKRIPGKNIKVFCGSPIISYSIQSALNSKIFDRVIVSTDDEEIAKISKEYGADVPFMRPKSLSDDYCGIGVVMQHAVQFCVDEAMPLDFACCIFATAPFIQCKELEKGAEIIQNRDFDYVFSATSFSSPIQRAMYLTPQNVVKMVSPENFNTRSQDLEQAWHDAGQFYWGKTDAWLKNKPIFSSNSSVVKIPRNRVQDIDDIEDWRQAELLFKFLQK